MTNALMNKNIFLLRLYCTITILTILTTFNGCESSPTLPPPVYPDGMYLFIERRIDRGGILIEGWYPSEMIDFPFYAYRSEDSLLEGEMDFPIDDHLLGIYGDWMSFDGVVGSGDASGLHGIFSLTFESESIKILGITADGVVVMKYRDTLRVLYTGQSLDFVSSRYDTVDTGIAYLTTSERVTNFGFWPKEKITPHLQVKRNP